MNQPILVKLGRPGSNSAFLSVKATLIHLATYTAEFAPPEALDELASYLLSLAATVAPFEMLSAEQLRLAAASDQEALQAAQALSCKQLKDALTFTTARPFLVQNLCDAITRTGKPHGQASQRSAPGEQHCAALLQRASTQAIGNPPGTAPTPAAINCHARYSAATRMGEDCGEQGWTSPHHAHHGKHHSLRTHSVVLCAVC